jgi:hypothetical protein
MIQNLCFESETFLVFRLRPRLRCLLLTLAPEDSVRVSTRSIAAFILTPSRLPCTWCFHVFRARADQCEGTYSSCAASSFLDLFFVESLPAAKEGQHGRDSVRGDHDCKDGFQSDHVSVEYDGYL